MLFDYTNYGDSPCPPLQCSITLASKITNLSHSPLFLNEFWFLPADLNRALVLDKLEEFHEIKLLPGNSS